MVQREGWYILNGTMEGDWEGEFTYIGARGSTVIHYVVVKEKASKKPVGFKVENKVNSDHMPVKMEEKE